MKKGRRMNEKGVTLMELMVSMAILSLVIFPLINSLTAFVVQSKEADKRLVLTQEATKQLEEQRQLFYDRMEPVAFTNPNEKPILYVFHVDYGDHYVGKVTAELMEQVGRYQLIKMTALIDDVDENHGSVEVSQYVTNR